MMRLFRLFFLCLLFLPGISPAQISLTLPSSSSCPGAVALDVQATNFNDVATFSLVVHFDTLVLSYDGHTGLNPAFSSGFFLINRVNQQVKFTWFSLTPVTLGNTTLLTLNFHHLLNQNTSVEWDDDTLGNCQITDINGNEISTTFIDAAINTTFNSPVPVTPANNEANVNIKPQLHWNGSACGPHYILKYSTDPDFLSDTITVNNIFGTNFSVDTLAYNTTYYWKVKSVINSTPYYTDWSEIFHFTTKLPDGVQEIPSQLIELEISPNPASENAQIRYQLGRNSTVDIQLISLKGEKNKGLFHETVGPGSYIHDINTADLGAGVYFIKIQTASSFEISTNSAKFVVIR